MEKDILQIKASYSGKRFQEAQRKNTEVEHLRKVLFKLSGPLTNKKVLFIGCGDGSECRQYAKTGALIYGIDLGEELIQSARKAIPGGKFSIGDFNNIKINSYFSSIFSILSLQYSADLDKSVAKLYHLLRPGGRLIVVVPHPVHKMINYNDGSYFIKGKRRYRWNGVDRFNYLYLTEDYINSFVRNNFIIKEFKELETPRELLQNKNMDYIYPIFSIYVLERCN